MDDEKNQETKITKLQLYFFVIAGAFLVTSTYLDGIIGHAIGLIGGSIFISNIFTDRFIEKINKREKHPSHKSMKGLYIGGLVAGLFMIPLNIFIYLRNGGMTIGLFVIFILLSIATGASVGFLINYIPSDQLNLSKN